MNEITEIKSKDSIISQKPQDEDRDMGEITVVQETLFTSELLEKFAAYLQVSEQSLKTYGNALRSFYNFLQTNGITEPDRYDVYKYIDTLKSERKAPSTIQLYTTVVRMFFRWAAYEGIYKDITFHLKSPKVSKGHKRDFFSPEQLRKIEQESFSEKESEKEKRDRAIFFLMVQGGLRSIEVVRANVGDFRSMGDRQVLYIQGKGRQDKSEFIPLGKKTTTVIWEYLSVRNNCKNEDPLFISCSNRNRDFNNRLTTRSIQRIIKDAIRNAGFVSPRLTTHSLRHSAVTNALKSGIDIRSVQQFARHSSSAITEIYAHDLVMLDNPVADVLDEIL